MVETIYLSEDIENVIKIFDMSVFNNKSILITGATGLLGKLCVKSLLRTQYNIKVIALVRNLQKAQDIFGENSKLKIIVQDINSPIKIDDEIDYIIHTASITSSKAFFTTPVETITTCINGTQNVLELAKSKNVKSFVYLSSLEVYGVQAKEDITEEDYGFLDILSPRSSYSEGKRMAENLCISYGHEYNLPVKIARLAQTFGPGVAYEDSRVFAQFARSVINKSDIILNTTGETKRNYCYTADAVRAIFTILIKGLDNNAYNVANKNTYISIVDMAKMLENENTKVKFMIDGVNRGYNPEVKIKLNSDKLERLGWEPKVDLKEMYERMIFDFRQWYGGV